MTVLVLGVPMGVFALLHGVFPIHNPDFSDSRAAFHFKDGVWTPGPRVTGLWGLQVSPQGAVRTIPSTRGGLCRLDGDRWTRYGKKEFGCRTDWLRLCAVPIEDRRIWRLASGMFVSIPVRISSKSR